MNLAPKMLKRFAEIELQVSRCGGFHWRYRSESGSEDERLKLVEAGLPEYSVLVVHNDAWKV